MKENLSFKEALDEVLNVVVPDNPLAVQTDEALGLVTSEDILAIRDIPGFDNSAMDGWAINTKDIDHALPIEEQPFNIIGESFAGHSYVGEILRMSCVKITTGAKIPTNADAVIPIENSKIKDKKVFLNIFPKKWENIRKFDNDIKNKEVLVKKGKSLTPADLANIHAQGIRNIKVYPKPTISFFTTGDEIVESSKGKDSIVNSNRVFLRFKLKEMGIEANYLGNASDSLADLKSKLGEAESRKGRLTISTGGVSMGEKDLVKKTLEESGWEILFWKARIKPGKPLLCAKKGDSFFLGLPGNPLSVAVLTEILARPIIQRLSGMAASDCFPQFHDGILSNDISNRSNRTTFLLGTYNCDGEKYSLEAFKNQSSQSLSLLSKGNALMLVPENIDFLEKGQMVKFTIL